MIQSGGSKTAGRLVRCGAGGLLLASMVVVGCSDSTRTISRSTPTATTAIETTTPTPTPTPASVSLRIAPYEVRDTSQPHQLTVYNTNPGGGSVGMPVRFGDINGDGDGDFVAAPMLADSGPQQDRRDSGEVHIYFGTGEISGVIVNTPEATDITTIMGARAGDLLGNEPFVWDLDADGFADILIGSQNYDGPANDRPNCGGVYLYRGQPQHPRTVDTAELPVDGVDIRLFVGAEAGDRLGIWVTAGDLDGDGALDAILGADQADGADNDRPDSGAIYVVFGGQDLPPIVDFADPGDLRIAVIHGIDPGDHFGSTIIATDVDGDGLDDLVAAGGLARGSSQIEGTFLAGGDGPDNARENAGDVYVLFSNSPFPATQDLAEIPTGERITMYGAEMADVAGEELAAGDLNGDGRVDIAVGSLQASGPGGRGSDRGAATGRTYLVFDAAARRGDVIDFANPGDGITTIYGVRGGSISGDTLIVVDMDGDGIDDIWVAAPALGTRDLNGVFRPASGVLDVILGREKWPATIDLLLPADDLRMAQIRGADANDQFAYGLAVGDANGDGKADVITNAMAGDGVDNQILDTGEFYVIDNRVLFEEAEGPLAPLYLNIDIHPIFAASCQPCHSGATPDVGLGLDTVQNSIAGLLGDDEMGRPSTEVDDLLVAPGSAADSYLIEKLDAAQETPPRVGDPMPLPPAHPLSNRVITEVRRWIDEGAPAANEDIPPPPPTPGPPAEGFSATFFARMRFVLSDPALGVIESVLLDPPAAIPLRVMGPRLSVPANEFETVTIPAGEFGDVDIELREDGRGVIGRGDGDIELSITFLQIALDGSVEIQLPARLTTGSASGGPFESQGQPLDPIGGTLKLVAIATIPADTAIVGGDPVLIELEGSVTPLIPEVPNLTDEIQPIFNMSCALANCHVGDGAAGLNLEAGRAFGDVVGIPSTQVDDLLVKAGDPDLSYLFEKVADPEPRIGTRMPIGNVLDPLDVEAIRQWIAGGAVE